MAEMIVFPAKEGRVGPAGERGSPTPSPAKSVERRWLHILVKQDEIATQEEKSILKSFLQKMRTILSFGCIHNTTTKGDRLITT